MVDTLQRQVVCGEGGYGDFAVLYRANAMSRVFEEALMAQSIPYEVVGGMRFFDRAEIKDMVAYLQVVHNPGNSLALRRVINNPTRGIGDSALSIIDRLAMVKQVPIFDALKLALEDEEIPARTLNSFRAFVELIEVLVRRSQEATLPQLAKEIIDRTGYREKLILSAKADDARRAENVEELVNVAARFVARRGEGTGLLDFLDLALSADIDKAEALGEKVSLLTLHSAKGLEFPYVFLVGLEEGLLPHYRSLGEDDDTEVAEERRLLYVGMTRAQRRLWLSRAQRRLQFGSIVENKPSRFLADLPKACVVHRGRSPRAGRASWTSPAASSLKGVGDQVVRDQMEMSGKPLDLTRILSRARSTAGVSPAVEPSPAASRQRRRRSPPPVPTASVTASRTPNSARASSSCSPPRKAPRKSPSPSPARGSKNSTPDTPSWRSSRR